MVTMDTLDCTYFAAFCTIHAAVCLVLASLVVALPRRESVRSPEKATLMTNMEGRSTYVDSFANELYGAEEVSDLCFICDSVFLLLQETEELVPVSCCTSC